ncbi:NosR/NirI family transcriptional regulator, nitrous oxide reductase regulator [Citreimonas salinaria]|uniref:NosR/NirI family transcriptional regulator, nitrous oxide reductase regulator n=2 Tax=Citreimonas salinaria TaxID=321339 RepID=A0A1H3NBV8_9RHOB|nr:NosR/NirI family transcriptional regulator, nitrous oxide reductase regulator [Citreimonas salinaria]
MNGSCTRSRAAHASALRLVMALVLAVLTVMMAPNPVSAADRLPEFLAEIDPGTLVPGADRFGDVAGSPPVVPALAGDEVLGFVFLNSDFADATGYSGKPIHIAAGIDLSGRITGLQLLEHQEPIVLIGIPEKRVVDAIASLVGTDVAAVAEGRQPLPQVDIVSGATVTVLVMGDSVLRAGIAVVRQGRLAEVQADDVAAPAQAAERTIDMEQTEVRDWQTLVGDGSVRRLSLSVGDVNEAFERGGNEDAIARPERGEPEEPFIDLYTALATIPTVGRSLLGEAAYQQMINQLEPGEHAIVVMGEGRYSFKGSGYVRGGIFDRIELIQDVNTLRFRDRDHTRLGDVEAEGAPDFDEVSLFRIPAGYGFEPTEPWALQLLVQRATGPLDKAFTTFGLTYTPPEQYIETTPAPQVPAEPVAAGPQLGEAAALTGELAEPLWVRMWRANTGNISVALAAIGVLTVIFFFQDALVKRYRLFVWVRRGFLAFTLVWIGWIANAQLSVVNVLTFANSLITGFSWTYFLSAPLIFIFWVSVAAGILFWGRGPFCGWLCPFGALQELLNNVARALKVPQINVPWGLNERLWPIKYIIFLGLFGLSFYSVAMAEVASEVEPFKTAITLKFMRAWPFVLFAVALLVMGLFIERFFCRYLCPLGAALAIPARLAMFFPWLKRHKECGSPCQRCAKECPVQCIHPDGTINPNECIWCMHCQDLFWDEHRCPSMIQKRLRREKVASAPGAPPKLKPDAARARAVAGHPNSTPG